MSDESRETDLKYAVDENPPPALSAAMGFQVVVLIIAGIVLAPVIVIRAAGLPDSTASWAVFAALIVCGITTMIQARPLKVPVLGRFGAFWSGASLGVLRRPGAFWGVPKRLGTVPKRSGIVVRRRSMASWAEAPKTRKACVIFVRFYRFPKNPGAHARPATAYGRNVGSYVPAKPYVPAKSYVPVKA